MTDSLITNEFLPPVGDFNLHLKSIFVRKIILNIGIQCFMFKMSKNIYICNCLKDSMSF